MAQALYELPVGTQGRLFAMACPASGSLESGLRELRGRGITHILSMLPEDEADALGVGREAEICDALGLRFDSFPIADFGLPDPASFNGVITRLTDRLQKGASIAVHCRAGIGRTGMVVSCLLVAQGISAERAIQTASDARGVSVPDTVAQAAFIKRFARTIRRANS